MKPAPDLKAIRRLAKLRRDENDDFRLYLMELPFSVKTIDQAVGKAYRAACRKIDCTACANCCRKLNPTLTSTDIKRLAHHLGIATPEFSTKYLVPVKANGRTEQIFKRRPCPFLRHNRCTIYAVRPRDCRSYPHLHRRGFVYRVRQAVENYGSCPLVFTTYESLKSALACRLRPPVT